MNGSFRESKSVTNRTQLFNCVKRKKGEIKVIIEAGRVPVSGMGDADVWRIREQKLGFGEHPQSRRMRTGTSKGYHAGMSQEKRAGEVKGGMVRNEGPALVELTLSWEKTNG